MKISYNWIKQFLKIDKTYTQVANILTDLGLEVEGIEHFETIKGGLKGVVVGEVLSCKKHLNADKLHITTVDIGLQKPLQIVCGASNVEQGQKVAVATIGTVLYDQEEKPFTIKKGKIRGEESLGMICAEDELGLGDSHQGIMVLDKDAKIGGLLSEIFKVESDIVFEIGLTPNRADAMSHIGVARDLKAGLQQSEKINLELITPSISSFRVDKHTFKVDVEIINPKLCPRYSGITISGITIEDSPEWLKNRLKSIGLTPKNNVVDITNYVLHELGQPLHAFDTSKIKGNKIIVKPAVQGTKFTTLDNVERTLNAEDLMIYDGETPIALAGIMGGKNSAVTQYTSSIFLESAYFDAVSVRKSAKRHSINSDASFRFERGVDPNITMYALKRAAVLIKQIAGGQITSDIIDLYPKKIENHKVFVNFDTIDTIIGEKIHRDVIKNILTSLEIKILAVSDFGMGLEIPPYRVDVQREIDVIEEILRVYGYNNITATGKFKISVSNYSKTEDHNIENIVSGLLTVNGFNEIMSNSLTTAEYVSLSEKLSDSQNVQIINPLSCELSVMRQSLVFGGLEAISYNINRKNSDLKLYEFGKTYKKEDDKYVENKHLALFITGNRIEESWLEKPKKSDFFSLKSYINQIFNRLGIKNVQNKPISDDIFSEGISFVHKNTVLSEFGVLKKSVIKHFDIRQEVLYADIKWENLCKIVSGKIKFTEIAKYPEVRRDLALLIDENVTFESVYQTAKQTDNLIKQIDLFDVYQGENLPKGKKSYAVSFILQDKEKTLTEHQIEKTMTKIITNLTQSLNASLRN